MHNLLFHRRYGTEEEFDTPLFDRENRHIILNATGKMLQKRLTPIIVALDAIPDEIKEAAQQKSAGHPPESALCLFGYH